MLFCNKAKKIGLPKKFLLAVNSIYRLVAHAMKKVRSQMCSRDYELLFLRFSLDCYEGIKSYEPLKKPRQPP